MRRFGRALGAAFSVVAAVIAAPLVLRTVWSWPHRVAVGGHSMEPTLLDGDWLLVDPDAYLQSGPAVGELIVAHDPRAPARVIVKRVVAVEDQWLYAAGDHPAHAMEAGMIGRLERAAVIGRPWLRYWPPRRFGRI